MGCDNKNLQSFPHLKIITLIIVTVVVMTVMVMVLIITLMILSIAVTTAINMKRCIKGESGRSGS